MSGDHPSPRTTLVRSHDRFVSASMSLGELLYVRAYSSWHSHERLIEIRWRHGSMDLSENILAELVTQGQKVLAATNHEPDCSGIRADLEDTA